MSIAPFPLPHVLAPLAALAGWLSAARSLLRRPRPAAAAAPLHAAPRPAPVVRPLRVIRVVDGRAGDRLVISGRLADVCAELDRLAAQEARGR